MERLGLYNYSKLKGLIREKNLTQEELAKAANINSATLSQKLRGRALFKQKEISVISNLLEIQPADIGIYFFTN